MDEPDKPHPRLSKHAEQRKAEGRPVDLAISDAQRANQSNVFVQVEDEAYIVRLRKAREHIFNPNGTIVTGVRRNNTTHLIKLRQGERRPVTEIEFQKFKEIFK